MIIIKKLQKISLKCGFINTLDFMRRKFYNITNNVYWDICKLLFPFYKILHKTNTKEELNWQIKK